MSAETSAWAKEQQCGDRTLKAVLREIANWARPDGIVEFLAIRRIAEVVEVSPRTVQRAIAALEQRQTDDDPDEVRLGLIRRVERFRPDGGQGACGFELVGYQPPMSITPSAGRAVDPPDKMSPPPDAGVTPPGDILSGEGVTPMSPLKRDKILPLSTTDVVDGPPSVSEQDLGGARGTRPHPLPDDWAPPAIDALQPEARGLVSQWPAGGYAAMAADFRNYWRDPGTKNRRKSDWTAALCNWLIRSHSQVMRASKAGVSYASAVPSRLAPDGQRPSPPPVAAQADEGDDVAALRAELVRRLPSGIYAELLAPAAIRLDHPIVRIIAPPGADRDWIAQRCRDALIKAAGEVSGKDYHWVEVEWEKMRQRTGAQ